MDVVQTAIYSGAKAFEFAGRLVIRLAQAGEWSALVFLALSCYACYYLAARLARTAIWTLKWTAIVFVVLAAVGWADGSWAGRRSPGSRGVDWWSREGAKGVPSGSALPTWEGMFSSSRSTPRDDTWSNLAKSASGTYARHSLNILYAYAQHGLEALDTWSADGISKVGQTMLEQMPPEQRRKLEKGAKARKRYW